MRSGKEVELLTLLAYDRSFIMTEMVCVRMCVSSFSRHSFKHVFSLVGTSNLFFVFIFLLRLRTISSLITGLFLLFVKN